MVFEAKIGLFGNSRQLCLGRYRSFFFVSRPILCRWDQVTLFSASAAGFFCWNSCWIVRGATLHHRPTIGRQFVMSVCRRLTFRHLKFSEMLAGRHWLTTENRQRVNWSIGRLWQIGCWTTVYGLRKNIYRLLVSKRRPGQQPHTSGFFPQQIKGMPSWLQVNIQQLHNFLCNWSIVKIELSLNV